MQSNVNYAHDIRKKRKKSWKNWIDGLIAEVNSSLLHRDWHNILDNGEMRVTTNTKLEQAEG